MKPGDSFGEIALFFSGEKRTATVVCQSDCTLLEIKRNMFYSLLQRNIALGAEMENVALSRISKDKARQLGRG
jgi:CRP-like cAMP-binding protein